MSHTQALNVEHSHPTPAGVSNAGLLDKGGISLDKISHQMKESQK